jgi:hypothetical protein
MKKGARERGTETPCWSLSSGRVERGARRKPSYRCAQFHMVRDLLAQVAAVGIAAIASETRTKPASVYRIKDAPAGAEAALAAWGM